MEIKVSAPLKHHKLLISVDSSIVWLHSGDTTSLTSGDISLIPADHTCSINQDLNPTDPRCVRSKSTVRIRAAVWLKSERNAPLNQSHQTPTFGGSASFRKGEIDARARSQETDRESSDCEEVHGAAQKKTQCAVLNILQPPYDTPTC